MFKKMEMAHEDEEEEDEGGSPHCEDVEGKVKNSLPSAGPRPMKCFTPPPDNGHNGESSEEYSDEEYTEEDDEEETEESDEVDENGKLKCRDEILEMVS